MVLRVTELVPVRTLEYVTPEMWDVTPGPLMPGQSFTDRFKRSLPFKVTVNNLGFRGAGEIPLAKRPGTYRVLCVGDSYTFGAYVNDLETWPAQLESALREQNPGRAFEAINAGISGFTITDELEFVKEHGLRLEPDAVVVGFVLNDLADLTRRVSSREMLKLSSQEGRRLPLGPVKCWLRQTAIYNMLFLVKAWVRKTSGNDPTIQEVDIRHLLKPVYDAQTLDLPDASFDAVICQLGLMLFAKPHDALAEMRRVAKPGAPVACLAQGRRSAMQFTALVMDAMVARAPHLRAPQGAPTLYAFGPDKILEEAFMKAGLTEIVAKRLNGIFRFKTPEEYWATMTEGAGRTGAMLRSLAPEVQAKVKADVLRRAAKRRVGGFVEIPYEFTMARGFAPSLR